MCLATIYMQNAEGEPVAEKVTNLSQAEDGVTFTTLFNETKTIPGSVIAIDFMDAKITVG